MKTTTDYNGNPIQAFQDADLQNPEFLAKIEAAKELWRTRCAEYYKINGDRGSCVVGAGIEVAYFPKRAKKAIWHNVIHPAHVSPAQGSCIWESSQKEVVQFLRESGIDCRFEHGRLD